MYQVVLALFHSTLIYIMIPSLCEYTYIQRYSSSSSSRSTDMIHIPSIYCIQAKFEKYCVWRWYCWFDRKLPLLTCSIIQQTEKSMILSYSFFCVFRTAWKKRTMSEWNSSLKTTNFWFDDNGIKATLFFHEVFSLSFWCCCYLIVLCWAHVLHTTTYHSNYFVWLEKVCPRLF